MELQGLIKKGQEAALSHLQYMKDALYKYGML